MSNEMKAYVDAVTFNNHSIIELEPDSIVVFVGPNNAGKSQVLRDIYGLIDENYNGVVANTVSFQMPPKESFIQLLDDIAIRGMNDGPAYTGLGFSINGFALQNYDGVKSIAQKAIRSALFVHLDTAARLSICEPPARSDYDQPRMHPIMLAAFDDSICDSLSSAFNKAFGEEISPNLFSGARVPLCIGPRIVAPGNLSQAEIAMFFNERYREYQQAHKQGDGMRSFLGVLLYLAIDYYKGLFIDEPEAFLHPPQAAILGAEIAESSSGKQVFLATHSKELLGGLLSVDPSRVKVVRITRDGNRNSISILDNDDVSALSATTLLKYSDVVNSLFHESVVLCESDADCKFYSTVASHLRNEGSISAWPLFLPTGGKDRVKQYVELLNRLGISVKAVVDIDMLANVGEFKKLVCQSGGSWDALKDDYERFSADLAIPQRQITVDYFTQEIKRILSGGEASYLSDGQVDEIKQLLPKESKWSALKRNGMVCLKGEQLLRFNRIDDALRAIGIHLVRVGELECFVREVAGHGPSWVNDVLEEYPNLDADVYKGVREFVQEWLD